MPSHSSYTKALNDITNLPDYSTENHNQAKVLASRIKERSLFSQVCDEVRVARSLNEIIDILKTALITDYILATRAFVVSITEFGAECAKMRN